jgi:hypothetical protein
MPIKLAQLLEQIAQATADTVPVEADQLYRASQMLVKSVELVQELGKIVDAPGLVGATPSDIDALEAARLKFTAFCVEFEIPKL